MDIEVRRVKANYDTMLISGQFYHNSLPTILTIYGGYLIYYNILIHNTILIETDFVYQVVYQSDFWKLKIFCPNLLQFKSQQFSEMAQWQSKMKKVFMKTHFYQHYQLQKYISNDFYSTTYKVSQVNNGNVFTVKIYKKNFLGFPGYDKQLAYSEIDILRSLNHKGIIKLEQAYQDDRQIVLVYQHIQGTTLTKSLEIRPLNQDSRKQFLYKIVQIVHELQKHKIVHRNICPDNIILASTGQFKLINFSGAIDLDVKRQYITSGRAGYAAPQLLREEQLDENSLQKTDIFSVGAIMYQIIYKKPIFSGKCVNEIQQKNIEGNFQIPKGGWDSIQYQEINILFRLLQEFQGQRYSAKTILESKFFKDINKSTTNNNKDQQRSTKPVMKMPKKNGSVLKLD